MAAPKINSSMATQSMSMNDSKASLFESVLIGAGVLAVSAASSKLLRDNLGITLTPKNAGKLVAAIAISNYVVDYAKKKDWVDVNRFKSP